METEKEIAVTVTEDWPEAKPGECALVPAKTEAPNMMAIIAGAVDNPKIDPDKLDKLLDLQIKMMDRQAEMDFNKAMARLRGEIGPVIKNKTNNQTKSKYADLYAVKKVADPLLAKFGFYDRYEEDYPEEGIIGTTCIITHENGHSTRNRVQFVLDDVGIKGTKNKTGVHAAASSMTYGQRISFCRALGIRIAEEDDDGNAAGSQAITPEQIEKIQKLLDETGTDIAQFCTDFAKVESLAEIPAHLFDRARAALLSRKLQQAEKKADGKDKEPEEKEVNMDKKKENENES